MTKENALVNLFPLIDPVININGSSRKSLIDDLLAVITPLRGAVEAMGRAMPHGRDYQLSAVNGERLDARARDAWNERRTILGDILREIENQAERIATGTEIKPAQSSKHVPIMVGNKLVPVIDELPTGELVLMRRDLDITPGLVLGEIVLCYMPVNHPGNVKVGGLPFATYQRNTNDSAIYRGHFFAFDDYSEAVRDFLSRPSHTLRIQEEANGKWSVYNGLGYVTGDFGTMAGAQNWIEANKHDYVG